VSEIKLAIQDRPGLSGWQIPDGAAASPLHNHPDMQRDSDYPPTPAQIAEECRQIRAHRAALRKPVPDDDDHDWGQNDWHEDEEE
jgi:hypothetical protein